MDVLMKHRITLEDGYWRIYGPDGTRWQQKFTSREKAVNTLHAYKRPTQGLSEYYRKLKEAKQMAGLLDEEEE